MKKQTLNQMKTLMTKSMTKSMLTIFLSGAFSIANLISFAQTPIYQLPNGGFETWYTDGGGTKGTTGTCPVGFNSFHSAECKSTVIIVEMGTCAGVTQCNQQVTDTRPGSSGQYALRMYSNNVSVLSVRANGNTTTGRIAMGTSTTANDTDKYNYTDYALNAPKHYQEFTGTPDSMRFWVKYQPGRTGATNATDSGRIRVYIHGTGECWDAPKYKVGKTEQDYYYGRAMKHILKEDGDWNCYTVPFVYDGYNTTKNANGNYYMLVSMTTHAAPGGGANTADQIWFDDIEFIYSALLDSLKINGTQITGFDKKLFTYGGPKLVGIPGNFAFPYNTTDFSWIAELDTLVNVIVTNVPGPNNDADSGYTSIVVQAANIANATWITPKEYRIYYYANLSDDNTISSLGYAMHTDSAAIQVQGFTPSMLNYNITLTDPEEVRIPFIRSSDITLSDINADIYKINQPTGVNSVGSVVVRAENYSFKLYTLSFEKVKSTNSNLNWIKVAGTDIPGFRYDSLDYEHTVTTCATSIPTVTYEKSSAYANISYTPATLANRTATIKVIAENGDTTVYKIKFVLTNNDAALTGYRLGSTNRNNFTSSNFVDVYAFSFTAAQTLSVQSSQQSCSASTVSISSPVLYNPDTNFITVTAQDGITTETYKVVLKNTNYALVTGNNNSMRYTYNGQPTTSINVTSANNSSTNAILSLQTLPVGPNVPPVVDVFGISAAVAKPSVHIKQPLHRNDTAIITLTANDGVSTKIFRLPFRATLSTDATLKSITYNNMLLSGFTPATSHYDVILPSTATLVPTIAYTPTFEWLPSSNIVMTPAATLLDTTFIDVTAENGTSTKRYSIAFKLIDPDKDAYLSSLKYNNIDIEGFNPTKYDYTIDIPCTITTPPVISGVLSSPTAILSDTQALAFTDAAKICVISEIFSDTNIYTVNFNIIVSTDTTLSEIRVDNTVLQGFDPQVFEYYYDEFPYTVMNAPVVTATTNSPCADTVITQIDTVIGTVIIDVIAEDVSFNAQYKIHFSRELSPVTDIDTVKYSYNSQNYAYKVSNNGSGITISLPAETEGIPLITGIDLVDNRAKQYDIDSQPTVNNNLTGIVIVTAEDNTKDTHNISFQRTLSNSTLLTEITYNAGAGDVQIQNFDTNITTYYVILPFNHSQNPTVSAVKGWKNTNILLTQPTAFPGQASILVTSEDGQSTKTYTIVFQRKGNANLVALSYNLGGTSVPVPNFVASTFIYNINLPIGTTAIPTLEYVAEDSRCIVDTIQQTTPIGTSILTLITWNQDDTITYTVNFDVLLSTEALLSDLLVDGVTVDNFNSDTLNYFVECPYGTITFPVVTAIATQPDARIEITQISDYPETAVITVYAGDTNISQTYTITFSVEAGDNNYLSQLDTNNVALLNFDKNILYYEIFLPYGTTQLPVVTAVAEDVRAAVNITDILQFGDTAKVEITALNGDVREYQIYFIISKSDNANAKNIFIDGVALADFEPTKRTYNHALPSNYSGLPIVTVELEIPNAKYNIKNITAIPGQATIDIMAEDTITTAQYRINFSKSTSVRAFNNYREGIHVYPNPASGVIYFDIKELFQAGNLEIYTIESKLIGTYTLQQGMNTIQIENLPNGMFFYKITADEEVIGTGKFVKNR